MASTDSRPLPLKNTAFRLYFTAYDSSGVPVTGFTSPDSERSLDGAAFADCTNEATYVGHGQGYIDLTATEMNTDHTGFYFECTEGSTRDCISICPAQNGSLPVNVVQCGGSAVAAGAIPNVAAGASGGLPLSVDAAGRVDVARIYGTAQTPRDIGASVVVASLASNSISSAVIAADAIGASQLATDAITEIVNATVAAMANSSVASVNGNVTGSVGSVASFGTLVADVADAVCDEDLSGHSTAGTLAKALSDVLADTGTDGVLLSSGTSSGQISLTSGVVLARDHEGDEIAKATNLATLISRVGSFTATGVNTVLGMFKALLSKTATLPSDVGGTFDPATDSTEALRDRGDAAWTTGTTPPTAAAIADAVCDEAVSDHTTAGTVGAQLASIYVAQIDFSDDEANTQDEYSVQWFKNGAPVTSGVTLPTIQVIKRADGTDLVASVAMSEIGSTGAYKYDATAEANRITDGEAVVVQVQATIDGSTRTWRKLVSRDASA